jgi:hypothetical protein
LQSSGGAKLFIDHEELISANGDGSIYLAAGYHDVEVQYFHNTSAKYIQLFWTLPGESSASIVPASRLLHAVASEYCDGSNVPRIMNFGILFELENGETVKVNL